MLTINISQKNLYSRPFWILFFRSVSNLLALNAYNFAEIDILAFAMDLRLRGYISNAPDNYIADNRNGISTSPND